MLIFLNVSFVELCCVNSIKANPNSLATAVTNFTKPGAHNDKISVDLSFMLDCPPIILLENCTCNLYNSEGFFPSPSGQLTILIIPTLPLLGPKYYFPLVA